MPSTFGAVHLAHEFLRLNVREGDICIDCTAGRGKDTAFLCELVGESGKVIALDIQPEAVESTKSLISERGFEGICSVYLDSHENVDSYAEAGTVSAIVFNFGWLPGGDHTKHTHTESSITALKKFRGKGRYPRIHQNTARGGVCGHRQRVCEPPQLPAHKRQDL